MLVISVSETIALTSNLEAPSILTNGIPGWPYRLLSRVLPPRKWSRNSRVIKLLKLHFAFVLPSSPGHFITSGHIIQFFWEALCCLNKVTKRS
jgi:hypothetical protein